MANSYKIAYPADGATVTARLYRGSTLIETVTPLDEDAGDYLNVYSKASGEVWQANDDVVYYDGTIVIGSETYLPESTPVGGSLGLVIPAGYVGDYLQNEEVAFHWNTNEDPSVDGTITVYKDGNDVPVAAIGSGITDTRHFDPVDIGADNNVHLCKIDLSASDFYAPEANYTVMLLGATINGETVDAVLATFSIENRNQGKQFRRDG